MKRKLRNKWSEFFENYFCPMGIHSFVKFATVDTTYRYCRHCFFQMDFSK